MPKPRKVEEPASTYSARPKAADKVPSPAGASGAVRHVDDKTFRNAADKVFKSHRELLRRLAQ